MKIHAYWHSNYHDLPAHDQRRLDALTASFAHHSTTLAMAGMELVELAGNLIGRPDNLPTRIYLETTRRRVAEALKLIDRLDQAHVDIVVHGEAAP